MERKLGLDGSWGYGHSRISILRERKRVLSVSFTHPQARTQQEDETAGQQGTLTWNQMYPHLDFGLQLLELGGIKVCHLHHPDHDALLSQTKPGCFGLCNKKLLCLRNRFHDETQMMESLEECLMWSGAYVGWAEVWKGVACSKQK